MGRHASYVEAQNGLLLMSVAQVVMASNHYTCKLRADVMWRARVWEKIGERGQNVHVQCVCTQSQLIVHMQKKREKEG